MSEVQSIRNPGWIWGAALIGIGLFFLRYGYGFGFSDQDEFLPLAVHILDKDLFLSDWFISMQFEQFSIRWPIALLVAMPSTFLPLWSVVFLLHLGTALGSGVAVARLTHRIFHSRTATLVAVVGVMALTTRWNPGGNDVLHAMLVPSSVAWCLILLAVERMHARRFLVTGFLLGAATLFHPLLGLQAGGLIIVVSLFLKDVSWLQRMRLAIPFLVILTPLVLVLASVGTASPEATYILTQLRAPHHYLPGRFSSVSWVLLGGLVLVAGLFVTRDADSVSRSGSREAGSRGLPPVTRWDRAFLSRMLFIPVGVLLISLFVTAWPVEWPLAQRLQPWAVSPLVRVLAVLTTVGFVIMWLKGRYGRPLGRAEDPFGVHSWRDRIIPLVGVIVLIIALYGLKDDIRGTSHPDRELHEWARENTDMDAIFVIPPSVSGFQFGASRAQYVSFKSFPFAPEPTLLWWERLQEIAPVEEPGEGGIPLLKQLDSVYVHRSLSDMRPFVASQDVDFIVRPADDPARWPDVEETEWCSDRWCVFWAGRILTQPARPTSP